MSFTEVERLFLDFAIKKFDSDTQILEDVWNYFKNNISRNTTLYSEAMLKLFLNQLENWIHDDLTLTDLSADHFETLEICFDFIKDWKIGLESDYFEVLSTYAEQVLITKLMLDKKDEYDLVVENIRNSQDPLYLKRFSLLNKSVENISGVYESDGLQGLNDNFSKYSAFEKISKFISPVVQNFLLQPSDIEIMLFQNQQMRTNLDRNDKGIDNNVRKRKREDSNVRSNQKKRRADDVIDREIEGSATVSHNDTSSDSVSDPPDDFDLSSQNQKPIKARRPKQYWDAQEVEALLEGVKELGLGNWTLILKTYRNVFKPTRISSDLKDKWRNLNKQKK